MNQQLRRNHLQNQPSQAVVVCLSDEYGTGEVHLLSRIWRTKTSKVA